MIKRFFNIISNRVKIGNQEYSKFKNKKHLNIKFDKGDTLFYYKENEEYLKKTFPYFNQKKIDLLNNIISGNSAISFNHINKNEVIYLFNSMTYNNLEDELLIKIMNFFGNSIFRKIDYNNSSKFYIRAYKEFKKRDYFKDFKENFNNKSIGELNKYGNNLINILIQLTNLNYINEEYFDLTEFFIKNFKKKYIEEFDKSYSYRLGNIYWAFWKNNLDTNIKDLFIEDSVKKIDDINLNKILQLIWFLTCFENNNDKVKFLLEKYYERKSDLQNFTYNLKTANIFLQIFWSLFPKETKDYLTTNKIEDLKGYNNIKNELLKDFMYNIFIVSKNYRSDNKNKHLIYIEYKDFNTSNLLIQKTPIMVSKSYYEDNLNNYLNKLNFKIEVNKIILFYEIDFWINDNIIIELNGNIHYIRDIDNFEVYKHNNYSQNKLLKYSQLKKLGIKKIINLELIEWKNILEKKNEQLILEYLKNLILNN